MPLTVTLKTSSGASTAVPVSVGVLSLVVRGLTVGVAGGVVSMISSSAETSVAVTPALLVTVAATV